MSLVRTFSGTNSTPRNVSRIHRTHPYHLGEFYHARSIETDLRNVIFRPPYCCPGRHTVYFGQNGRDRVPTSATLT